MAEGDGKRLQELGTSDHGKDQKELKETEWKRREVRKNKKVERQD
jgi:hypothetical protein